MNDYPFGNFLYELRTEKRLSQDELGEMLGVSNKAVSKWEMGVSKPRPAMLLRLSEIFGVTIEELLRGKREEKQESLNEDGEELSTAFNEQIKALRKLRKSLLASIVSWVLSIIAIAATVTISQALYNDIVGWAVVFLCIFLFSYFASFIWVIAFAVSLRKRKRLLHKSFPKHTKELNDKSVIKNQKVSFFVFFFLLLAFTVVLVVLSTRQGLKRGYLGLIELGFIGALCLANILFTYINISKIAKLCDKGDYERAIIKGEWLLKAWLPNGSSTLNDFLRLNIAVAYFSLEDDEHFLEYLHRLSNKKLLIGKSYWQCIYYFSQRNAEAYNVELNSVFTPLAEKDKSKASTLYSDILQLVSGLINETLPFDIKEMLRNLVKNPRVRKIVEEYGSDA